MKLSEDQLEEIEEHAANLMTLEEIAEIMEVPFLDFLKEYQSKDILYRKIRRGRLITKSMKQKSEIDLAHRGHASAQKSTGDLITKIERADEPYQTK